MRVIALISFYISYCKKDTFCRSIIYVTQRACSYHMTRPNTRAFLRDLRLSKQIYSMHRNRIREGEGSSKGRHNTDIDKWVRNVFDGIVISPT